MRLFRHLERVSDTVAFFGALLMIPLVIAMVYEVLSRYLFSAPTIWAFELSYMMMAGIFSFGFAYALKCGQHVNVDFIHGAVSPRWRAMIDLIGYSLFLPCCIWLSYGLFQYALRAFRTGEVSGLSAWNPVVWPLRTVLFVGFAALSLQALIQVVKAVDVLVHGQKTETDSI